MDDLKERPRNWRYRGEDQIADELREIAKELPCSQRQMHLEMAAQIVEQGQFLHPNDFGMAIENADLRARIEALEAKVKEAGEALHSLLAIGPDHEMSCSIGPIYNCTCDLHPARQSARATLAKLQEPSHDDQ